MLERTLRANTCRSERTDPTSCGRRVGAGKDRNTSGWSVEDDLPRPIPVGRAEIDVLETFLGRQIDDILREVAGEANKVGSNHGNPFKLL